MLNHPGCFAGLVASIADWMEEAGLSGAAAGAARSGWFLFEAAAKAVALSALPARAVPVAAATVGVAAIPLHPTASDCCNLCHIIFCFPLVVGVATE